MNSKKILLSLALLVLLYSWYARREPIAPPPTALKPAGPRAQLRQVEREKPTSMPRPMPNSPSAPKEIVAPAPETKDPHKPPPHSVPFELKNGWVVTYGDILLGKPTTPDFPQTGFIEEPHLHYWEKSRVPFSVDSSLPNPERVLRAIAYFNEFSPVRFTPFAGEENSVVFFPSQGECLSYLGKIGGHQPIYLDDRCGEHEVTHEMMHALGFIHEQSRADRDQYIEIHWNNIETDKQIEFDVTPPTLNEPLKGRPFDYRSVMMYPTSIFSLDRGQPTMSSRTDQAIEPTLNGLSTEDLERLRQLYGRAN